jgi:ATP-dependent Lhr-like helicase
MFPVLADLVARPTSAVGALYIAPIKALLNNQEDRLGRYTEMVGLRRFLWHGDVGQNERRQFLREPCELLMTTPESLEVMLVSPKVPAHELFADLRCVVIDEIHAMAGTDRGAHLMSVLERIARFTPHDIQRIGLSATVGNPATILGWLQGSSLAAVCKRELGRSLDKTEQTSDWTRRPLSERQIAYAALDGEVLLALHERFKGEMLV